MRINKPYTRKERFELGQYCNSHNCHIEDRGDYLESVENEPYVPTYADLRRAEYPTIADQLDMIYWDSVNGTNIWQDTISEIKAKYPKE